MRKLNISFRNAFRGIFTALSSGRNMKIHVASAAVVTALAVVLRVEAWCYAALAITFGLVICFELVNTSIEALCDYICPEKNDKIRRVKDIAAGAVLFAALMSIAVAAAVFLRPVIFERMFNF